MTGILAGSATRKPSPEGGKLHNFVKSKFPPPLAGEVLRPFDNLRQDGYDADALKKNKKVDPCPDPLH